MQAYRKDTSRVLRKASTPCDRASDPAKYIEREVIPDKAFLSHTVGFQVVPIRTGKVVEVFSPILRLVDAYRARIEFNARGVAIGSSSAFSWLFILVLPLGIGLRVLKTSLELFAQLN